MTEEFIAAKWVNCSKYDASDDSEDATRTSSPLQSDSLRKERSERGGCRGGGKKRRLGGAGEWGGQRMGPGTELLAQ